MDQSTEGQRSNLDTRVQCLAYTVLLLLALAASSILVIDVSNYIRSAKSVGGLDLTLVDLTLVDDDDPRALVHMRLQNNAPLAMQVERYQFELYLGQERVGSSYSTYLGTDPSVDPETRREATTLNRVLAAGQSLDLEFVVYIYATQMEQVRDIRRSGGVPWHVNAEFVTVLPYARGETRVTLTAGFEE